MNWLNKKLNLILVLLVVTGCSSQPEEINYYLLHTPDNSTAISTKQGQQLIVLQSLDLAEYLQNQHIVMQLQSSKLQFSSKHRWAENLQSGIEKSLLASLNRQRANVLYISRNQQISDMATAKLFVSLEHFLITEGSTVVVSGSFWLKSPHVKTTIQSFNISRTLDSNGYPHAIEQLRESIEQLAKQISSKT